MKWNVIVLAADAVKAGDDAREYNFLWKKGRTAIHCALRAFMVKKKLCVLCFWAAVAHRFCG